MLKIRQGVVTDADSLSQLAFNALTSTETDPAKISQAQPYLTFTNQHFPLYYFGVVEDPMIIGFYALNFLSKAQTELKALYVQTVHQRKGYGRALLNHAKIQAKILGNKELVLASCKGAERFFIAMGAQHTTCENLSTNTCFCTPMSIKL